MDSDVDHDVSLDASLLSQIEEESNVDDLDSSKISIGTMGASTNGGQMEQQLILIEEMVHEMKQGFVNAMEELSKIQEGDHSIRNEMVQHKKDLTEMVESIRDDQNQIHKQLTEEKGEQLQQLADLITSLKTEVKSISTHLQDVLQDQKNLHEKVDCLQSERDLLLEELLKSGAVSDKIGKHVTAGSMNEYKSAWQDHESEGTFEHAAGQQDHMLPSQSYDSGLQKTQGSTHHSVVGSVEDDVTASACKCLSLLQALEERCILPDLSDSSDEDAAPHAQQWPQNHDFRSCVKDKSSRRSSMPAPNKFPDLQAVDAAERQQSVQDIVDSEREYCNQLWSLIDGYLNPLQDGHYISSRELSLLFPPYLNQLYDQHCQMLDILQERLLHWNWGGLIGDVFARMTDSQTENLMSLYKEYLSDFPGAVGCLRRQITQSRKFRQFIKRDDRPCSGDIISLLTAPIRRIPQYSLLLQQLLKHTPPVHPDHYTLQSSLSRLRSFVDQFSEEITQSVGPDKETSRVSGQSVRSSPSGSSCEAGQLPSARDSGIHSNGEENHTSRHMNSSTGYLPDWIEHSSSFKERTREYQLSRLAARSQPDLTFGRHMSQHPDRSGFITDGYLHCGPPISTLPSHSDRLNHHKRYKMKKRNDRSGVNYRNSSLSQTSLPPDYVSSYSGVSQRFRPASAIDFLPHPESTHHRLSRDHLNNRPQSALGGSYIHDVRNRSLHHQLLNRKFTETGNASFDNSLPASHSITPRESPRILVNGRPNFAEGSHGRFDNMENYGVYGDDEDDTRVNNSYTYGYNVPHRKFHVDQKEIETDYSEDIELAASLANSLRDEQCSVNTKFDDRHHVHSQWFDVEHNKVPRENERRDSVKYSRSDQSPEKNDTELHVSELHINLETEKRHQDNLENLGDRRQISNFTDSSGQNSSCEDSIKSQSQKSEKSTIKVKPKMASNEKTSFPQQPVENFTRVESQNGDKKAVVESPVSGVNNSEPIAIPVPHPQLLTKLMGRRSLDTSVLSYDERLLPSSQGKTAEFDRKIMDSQNSTSNFPLGNQTATNPQDLDPSPHGKKESKKKKRETKRYSSMENLSKSTDDITGSRKSTLKSSLKHFFGKKKGSVRMDKLEAAYVKEHGLDHTPEWTSSPCSDSCTLNGALENIANNKKRKSPLSFLFKDQDSHPCSTV